MNFKTVMDIFVMIWIFWQIVKSVTDAIFVIWHIVIYNKKVLLYILEAHGRMVVLGSILDYVARNVIIIAIILFYSWR